MKSGGHDFWALNLLDWTIEEIEDASLASDKVALNIREYAEYTRSQATKLQYLERRGTRGNGFSRTLLLA